jgi:hypothetical protein
LSYAKVFEEILDSSVWDEDATTRLLWITLLVMADQHGVVSASMSGLVRRANMKEAEVVRGLKVLEAPDKRSKDPDHGGRRIQPIEGGWEILNYGKYRGDKARASHAAYMRDYRARKRAEMGGGDEAGAAGDSGGEPARPRAVRRDRAGDVAAEAPQPVAPVKKPKKGQMNPLAEAVFVQCRDIAQLWEKVDALMKGKVPIPEDQRDPATLLKTISEFDTGNGIKSTSDFTTLSEKWAQQIMGSGELDEMRHKAKKALFDAQDWAKKQAVDEPEEEEADPREELIDRVAEAANAAAKLLGRSPSEVLGVYGNPNEMALDELADFAARIEHDVAELKRNDAEMPPLPPEPERDTGGAPF